MEECSLIPLAGDLPYHWQPNGFLWTWTFPDFRGQSDHRYAMKCWRRHADWLTVTGKRCVRSIERGGLNGHYHFHGVTDQRWDILEVLEHAQKCGFGRVNVEVIPRERIYYVAKYIGKKGRWPMPKNVRLWACVGFIGLHAKDIRFRGMSLTVPLEDVSPPLRSVTRWTLDGKIMREKLLRPDWNGDESEIHTMNITKENGLHLVELLSKGSLLGLGEYRTCTTRKLAFVNEKTEKKEVRKIVEHGLEFGNDQITVSEWLPDDADLSTVKPPAAKGEAVVVEIQNFSPKYGITAKSIRSLANFNGKLS